MKTYIYKITRNDDLEYIGITIDIKRRIKSHSKSKRFKLGIKKYEILKECDSYEEAEILEELYINQYNTFNKGLNITKTGKGLNNCDKFNTLGISFSEETKSKIREKAKQRYKDKRKTPMFGKKHSEETKKKWSEKRKGKVWGKIKFSEETIIEILNLYKNKPFIDGVGERQKNCQHILTYKNAFCKKYSEQYNCTSKWMSNLILGKMITWNPIVNRILNTKF